MMSKRMEQKKQERRNRILDVAEAMMSSNGINGLTMEDVAKDADVAIGTQYLYFKNKNSLCAAVIVRLLKKIRDAQENETGDSMSVSGKLLAYRTALREFIVSNPERWKAVRQLRNLDLEDESDENVRELLGLFNDSVQIVAEYYREGIKAGLIRPEVNPVPTAIFLVQQLISASEPSPLVMATLRLNSINIEQWNKATNELLTSATHVQKIK